MQSSATYNYAPYRMQCRHGSAVRNAAQRHMPHGMQCSTCINRMQCRKCCALTMQYRASTVNAMPFELQFSPARYVLCHIESSPANATPLKWDPMLPDMCSAIYNAVWQMLMWRKAKPGVLYLLGLNYVQWSMPGCCTLHTMQCNSCCAYQSKKSYAIWNRVQNMLFHIECWAY